MEQWHTAKADIDLEARKFFLEGFCKPIGQLDLVLGENVYGKMLGFEEYRMTSGADCLAPKN